jgi:predicted ATPase
VTGKLSALEMRNFKCFRRQPLEFGNLTILTGLNGMGKSSVIQALLLLRQSLDGSRARRLKLSGDLVDLGTGSDVFFDLADEDVITFALEVDNKYRFEFQFEYDRRSSALQRVKAEGSENQPYRDVGPTRQYINDGSGVWRQLPIKEISFDSSPFRSALFSKMRLQYLAAERLGPRKMLPWADEQAARRSLGVQGEYVWAFLARYGAEILPEFDPRLRKTDAKTTVEGQVTAWLQEASPGSILKIDELRTVDALAARYAYERKGDVASPSFRATNVGFGLSYILPVLTALIAARPGDIVIVENPEAHLHPRGQTKIGELACHAASAGVQVIIETHSDHFLDGVRLAARSGCIDHKTVRIHYFTRHGPEAAVISPSLQSDGRLSEWPKGFFDERDENLVRLLKPVA